MHKRQWDTVLYGIAEDQSGYFTAAQARAAGLHQVRLVQLAQQGDIERVSRGVYRFTRFPVSRLGHYMEAVLWPQVRRPDVVGVVSHQSALSIHGLSDVSPARVHMTLPTTVRIRREVPKGLVIHYADLAPGTSSASKACPSPHPQGPFATPTPATLERPRRPGDCRWTTVWGPSMAEADRLERELLGTRPGARTSARTRRDAR